MVDYHAVFDEASDEGDEEEVLETDADEPGAFGSEDDRHRSQVRLGVDEVVVAAQVRDFPDHLTLRSLQDRTTRLHLLMGDKDGVVADHLADIEGDLRTLILEIKRDPTALVISVLGMQCDEHAITHIEHLMEALTQRRDAILASQRRPDLGQS